MEIIIKTDMQQIPRCCDNCSFFDEDEENIFTEKRSKGMCMAGTRLKVIEDANPAIERSACCPLREVSRCD